jgi:hypothetical protein
MHAFLPDGNQLHLLGNPDEKSLGNNCAYAIWTLDLKKILKRANLQLDYPYVYPYGWRYRPADKIIPFWRCQKITMENMGNDVAVRYTTDGSWPTEGSKLYDKPFVINRSMKIIARAFKKGMYSSNPFTVSYSKIKPKDYLVGDFNHDGKDEVLAHVGYLIKSQEDANGESETVLNTKAYGSFFTAKGPDGNRDHIGYRRGKNIYIATTMRPLKYMKTVYSLKFAKSIFVAGDFNGDGKTDAMFANGRRLHFDFNRDGKIDRIIEFHDYNVKRLKFIPGDWNGDGKDDIIIKIGGELLADTNLDGEIDIRKTIISCNEKKIMLLGDWEGNDKTTIRWEK